MDVEKLILLMKDHEAIYDTSRCEHRNRDCIASVWMKIAQEMGTGKWSASVFHFLL
jgi:ribulose kinase